MKRFEYADGMFRSIVKSAKTPDMAEPEEHIMMRRENGIGPAVWIPISMLYVFTEDRDEAFYRMAGYCDLMWGRGGWTRGELTKMAQHIGKRLDDLVNTAPMEDSKDAFAKTMEQLGVQLKADGETILDFTSNEKKRDVFLGSRQVH